MNGLKEGDLVVLDAKCYKVTSIDPMTGSYWFQEEGKQNYHSIRILSSNDVSARLANGSLKPGKPEPVITGGPRFHVHTWKTYVGATVVDYFCECGAKKEANWYEIGKDTK